MVPKLCGMDVELGNFIAGAADGGGTGALASRLLLAQIDGVPASSGYPAVRLCGCGCGTLVAASANAQDNGRKFLRCGGSAYIDLDHCELATAETVSARSQVAALHAMLAIARRAQVAANAGRAHGARIEVLFNNSDGRGNSYGSHVNFLLSRRAWDRMFDSRLQDLLYLAAFQASMLVLTGQGKVGAENGTPSAAFQLSQRADFFEALVGPQTTFRRPLVNTRNEPLAGALGQAGPAGRLARLHVICFDASLCHVATFLKLGTMQIVLAMIEAGQADVSLLLDDPLGSVRLWSRDLTFQAQASLADGRAVTLLGLQRMFFDDARRFVESGQCEDAVPDAGLVLAWWDRVLTLLEAGDTRSAARYLDWALKRTLIERAMEQAPELSWASPAVKHLDFLYGSLDPSSGLYWACERGGLVEPLVSEAEIAARTTTPPEETRAWTRGLLLERAGGLIESVDWDVVRIRPSGPRWAPAIEVRLDDPLGWTRRDTESCVRDGDSLDELVGRLTGRA